MGESHQQLYFRASKVFTPAVPINAVASFAGRTIEQGRIIDTINQAGRHAVVFGEAGVGKTSFAKMLSPWLSSKDEFVKVGLIQCDNSTDYSAAWRNILTEIAYQIYSSPGEYPEHVARIVQGHDLVDPYAVRKAVEEVDANHVVVLIFDEFNQMDDDDTRMLFANTIKSFSDQSIGATIVLVGVAEDIKGLLAGHSSIIRNVEQIRLSRMTTEELGQIIDMGMQSLGMSAELDARAIMMNIPQGLPHYAHLLALNAVRNALNNNRLGVIEPDVQAAIRRAVESSEQTVRDAYHTATDSPRDESLAKPILLGCALAKKDALGYFAQSDVLDALRKTSFGKLSYSRIQKHMKAFTEEPRGRILERKGEPWQFRYRFRNPLVQPYVLVNGISAEDISVTAILQ